MVMRMVRWMCGVLNIRIRGAELERFLNACSVIGVHPKSIRRRALDEMTAEITLPEFRRLFRAGKRTRCRVHIMRRRGLPFWWKRMKRRYALWLCVLLCALMCYELCTRIWVIETNFPENVDGYAVMEELEKLGVGIGSKSAAIDAQAIKVHMITTLDNLSFFAVNLSGNTLSLETAAAVEEPEKQYSGSVSSVVAVKDGVIVKQIVRRGTPLCRLGDGVTAGMRVVDALVKPYTEEGSEWLTDASADIWAHTKYTARRAMCTIANQKIYTGEKKTSYALCFGKIRVNLSVGSCCSQQNCDRIRTVHTVRLNENFALPVSLLAETRVYYRTQPVALEDAFLRARLEYGVTRCVQREIDEGNITQMRTEFASDGGRAQLDAVTECYEQIGCAVADSRTQADLHKPDEAEQQQ